jgi:hypothetical protein
VIVNISFIYPYIRHQGWKKPELHLYLAIILTIQKEAEEIPKPAEGRVGVELSTIATTPS